MDNTERAEKKKDEVVWKIIEMVGSGSNAEQVVDTVIEMMSDSEDFMQLATREQMIEDIRVRFNIQ